MPSWCVTQKQIIFGISPVAVKSVLLRQAGEKSLADLSDVGVFLSAKEPLLSIAYVDTPKLFEAIYPFIQIALPMVAARFTQDEVPIDVSSVQFPTPRTIGRHLRPSISVVRRTKLGIETETRETLPILSLGATVPLAVSLALPAAEATRWLPAALKALTI